MSEGKDLATSFDAKFIETSAGIKRRTSKQQKMCHLNILLAGLKHNVDELLVGVLKQILLRQVFQIHKYTMNKHTNAIHLQIQLHNTGGGSANSTNNQDLIFSKVMKKKSFTKPVHQTFHFYQICIFHLDAYQRPSNQIQSNP